MQRKIGTEIKRVVRILFVCHGNICRSPMAEYIFKHLVRQAGLEDRFEIASAGVSDEEDGNDIYLPAKLQLREHGIPYGPHKAHEMTREEYEHFDKIICADRANLSYIPSIGHVDYDDVMEFYDPGEKESLMMQWAGEERDVSDPWYTRNFDAAYRDIHRACQAILDSYIREFEWREACGEE